MKIPRYYLFRSCERIGVSARGCQDNKVRTLCPSLCPSLSNDEYLIIPIPVQPRPVHYPGHRPSSLPLFKVITHQGKVSFKSPQPVSRPRAERSNFNPIERFLVKKNSRTIFCLCFHGL